MSLRHLYFWSLCFFLVADHDPRHQHHHHGVLVEADDVRRNHIRWYCELHSQPIVKLTWSSDLNSYVLWNDDDDDTNTQSSSNDQNASSSSSGSSSTNSSRPPKTRRRRRLPSEEDDEGEEENGGIMRRLANHLRGGITNSKAKISPEEITSDWDKALPVTRNVQQNVETTSQAEQGENDVDDSDNTIVLARYCPCWDPSGTAREEGKMEFFCPLSKTHCGIIVDWDDAEDEDEDDEASQPHFGSFVYDQDPGCDTIDRKVNFVRNTWPVIICWYLALLFCLLLTRTGRNAMGCCISSCCCCCCCCCGVMANWNDWAVDRILRGNPVRAHHILFQDLTTQSNRDDQLAMIQFALGLEPYFSYDDQDDDEDDYGNHRSRNNARQGVPSELVLRTKTFRNDNTKEGSIFKDKTKEEMGSDNLIDADSADGNDANDDDGGSISTQESLPAVANQTCTCTICHAEIENGDRVGDLPCHHLMHIDCLKTWIVRRNVCPLCLAENIATPRDSSGGTTASAADTDNANHS